jgi:hypothetical protein
MRVHREQLPSGLLEKILRRFVDLIDDMSPQGFCTILWSFSELQLSWKDLTESTAHPNMTSLILSSIDRSSQSKSFNSQSLSMTIYSLSKLLRDVDLVNQPDESLVNLLSSLQTSFLSFKGNVPAFAFANIVYGFAKVNVPESIHSPAFKLGIISMARDTLPSMNEQELGNTVWGMSRLGINLNLLSATITASIMNQKMFIRRQALVAILQSFGFHSDYQWSKLDEELAEAIRAMILRLFPNKANPSLDDVKFVGLLLRCLGDIGMDTSDYRNVNVLEKYLLPYVNAGLSMISSKQLKEHLINAVTGLSQIQSWKQLSVVSSDNTIERFYHIYGSTLTPRQYATFLWSLGRMSYNLQSSAIGTSILALLANKFDDMTAYEVAWSIWALGRLNLRFDELDRSIQTTMMRMITSQFPSMNPKERAVMLWSIGELNVPVNDLPDNIKLSMLSSLLYLGSNQD